MGSGYTFDDEGGSADVDMDMDERFRRVGGGRVSVPLGERRRGKAGGSVRLLVAAVELLRDMLAFDKLALRVSTSAASILP